jgi:metal-sulfur cluster biosynthetic enzyme
MSGEPTDEIHERIKDALRMVIDPEIGLNVVDLGLIYEVKVEASTARILMSTTTRGCPATDYLHDGVQQAASDVSGIDAFEVTVTYDPPWDPDIMSDESKSQLGFANTWVY